MWNKLKLKVKRLFCRHHLHWAYYPAEGKRICSICGRVEVPVKRVHGVIRYSVWEEVGSESADSV